jgi:hypothetical protein
MHLEISSGEFFGKIAMLPGIIVVGGTNGERPKGTICIKPVAGLAQQHSQECMAERHRSSRLFFA